MPNVTTNYGLKKPLQEEFYNVEVQNENMDTIDAQMKAIDTAQKNNAKSQKTHVEDKNNPHGVTAEQVGATPASHAEDKNNPHGVTASQVGAFPSTGGNVKGELGVAYSTFTRNNPDARAVVKQGADGDIGFYNELVTDVYCGLRVQPIAANTDATGISNLLRFRIRNNNFNHMYMMYGSHNITKGETDLEAGVSELATGCIHLVYE
jgi:hypothetical protein